MLTKRINRRRMLSQLGCGVIALGGGPALAPLWAEGNSRRFRIGACDWSIGKMADPVAFDVAREIGLDGIQVSLGSAQDDMQLRRSAVQKAYREAAAKTGVAVASLAIGALNEYPYKKDPRTIDWVSGGIEATAALGCKVMLLAFFGNGDLKGDRAGTDEVVRRLKAVAPLAERQGVILGLESWLSAEEHVDIIERVGSSAVQVYYDVRNSSDKGYDIYQEIRWLGKKRLICEFHAKENGQLLGQGGVDFKKVRAAMDDIEYSGWIQIEGAVPSGAALVPSYQHNQRFLREQFA